MKPTLKAIVLLALRGYKQVVSPLLPPACRYVPSCSEYAMEAVERYGVGSGLLLSAWRLLRCHPFAKGGFDPVTRVGTTLAKATRFSRRFVMGPVKGLRRNLLPRASELVSLAKIFRSMKQES